MEAIKRRALITNGTTITFTEQRYVSKRTTSYHDAVAQQAAINKFDTKIQAELTRIKNAIESNPERALEMINDSATFTVLTDATNMLFADQIDLVQCDGAVEVQRDRDAVELEIAEKVRSGNVLGLSQNTPLRGGRPVVDQFRALSDAEQLTLIGSVITEIDAWRNVLRALPPTTGKGGEPGTSVAIAPKATPKTQTTKSATTSAKSSAINKLDVVISIDFEWSYTQTEQGEVRTFGDVLSGQYAMFFPQYPDVDIHGIIFNDSDKGFNFRQFFLALVDRIQDEFVVTQDGIVQKLELSSLNVLLTGYFMGVDFSAMTGWNMLKASLTVIDKQKIFSLRPYVFNVRHKKNDAGVKISMTFRDTALLAPQGGLKKLGEVVGVPKIDTSLTDQQDMQSGVITQEDYDAGLRNGGYYKSHMGVLLKNHPQLYADYALNDSIVALKYLQTVVDVYGLSWSNFNKIPPTTSNYAMRGAVAQLEHTELDQRIFTPGISFDEVKNDPLGCVRDQYRDLYALSSDAYFGGFNVSFGSMVGCGLVVDSDLVSAYVSGGAMMSVPHYDRPMALNTLDRLFQDETVLDRNSNIDFPTLYQQLKHAPGFPIILGTVRCTFAFPDDYTGIVTTPQRSPKTDNPVYVKHGIRVSMPLIDVIDAYEHGAEIQLHTAIIPAQSWDRQNVWSSEQLRFLKLRQEAKKNRDQAPKDSFDYIRYDAMQLLFKLAGNTVYGKSAQSIRTKKSRNYMTNEMDAISISKISDPVIAGSFTAITRYLVHHLYDAVAVVYGDHVLPLNITTDGYTFALLDNAQYDFDVINAEFNRYLPDYYRQRLASIGFNQGFERKGDQTNTSTRFYNGRTRFNGTLDVDSLHAMGGVYYASDDDLSEQVKQIYRLYLDGEISISSESSRMSNLTEMKYGSRNHAQGVMYDWVVPVRIPLQYDCAYRPAQWIGNRIDGFGFVAVPFNTVEEHDTWKRNSKVLTDRWNIMRDLDRYETYLETMRGYSFKLTGKTLDDPDYRDKARYVFSRLAGETVKVSPKYRDALHRVKAAIRDGKKLPICKMAIFENKKVGK